MVLLKETKKFSIGSYN